MKARKAKVRCRACKKENYVYKEHGFITSISKDLKARQGWLLNFKNPLKSLCPNCNLGF
jgi:hypothetical protein